VTDPSTTDQDSSSHLEEIPGIQATKPQQIPWPGWRGILARTWRRTADEHLDLIAAGMAFYVLLALFPALTVMVALYGLISDPSQVGTQFAAVKPLLPGDAYNLINDQMRGLASGRQAVLGTGVIVGILISAWSATKFAIVLGALLNAEMERQTGRDSTRAPECPRGMRGAYVADHLPEWRGPSIDRHRRERGAEDDER